MSLSKKARGRLVAAISLFFLVMAALADGDSHRANPRHWAWKQTGWGYSDPMEPLRFISVDADFRASLVGKAPAELRRWLPLRPSSKDGPCTGCGQEFLADRDFSWIGPSTWAVEWKNGRAAAIFIVKGI